MKKAVSLMLIFSVVFMGFAATFAQGTSLSTFASNNTKFSDFDILPFETELSADELAQVEGENGIVVGVVVGYAVSKAVDNIPTRGGKSTLGKDIDKGIQRGYKAADKSLSESARRTGRKCAANPRRCAD